MLDRQKEIRDMSVLEIFVFLAPATEDEERQTVFRDHSSMMKSKKTNTFSDVVRVD